MPRTVTLDHELEESLRWFRTWRGRFLEVAAKTPPDQLLGDDGEDARSMMDEHAFYVALQLAAHLGDEEAAGTWREILDERRRQLEE